MVMYGVSFGNAALATRAVSSGIESTGYGCAGTWWRILQRGLVCRDGDQYATVAENSPAVSNSRESLIDNVLLLLATTRQPVPAEEKVDPVQGIACGYRLAASYLNHMS